MEAVVVIVILILLWDFGLEFQRSMVNALLMVPLNTIPEPHLKFLGLLVSSTSAAVIIHHQPLVHPIFDAFRKGEI
jgi:hypothetical protein